MVFEAVAEEVEFLRNIDWDAGERVRKDLVARGLLRPSYRDEDGGGGGLLDASDSILEDGSAIPEDLLGDE